MRTGRHPGARALPPLPVTEPLHRPSEGRLAAPAPDTGHLRAAREVPTQGPHSHPTLKKPRPRTGALGSARAQKHFRRAVGTPDATVQHQGKRG